ncbi:MAG: chromosome segregation protein SMC, partial [Woeseiaceae bacterium]|nr:chromosome segregation protein SMC [Woeseiaceae bacterium]
SKIKLAGFKSFVDSTTIPFPSSLVGVVGPNGCGKSNVIDAVRWVMGESSASRLRGDSITDVIFNGSSSRKPVGAASVELLFDNSETTLEGQYAKYAEIAIRREVSRDGVSTYYLNGTRCRRKDITGVFLGTGLGPRSYSIIEQGMISRIIEAKPEEMRTFIEEAAGISKYKERRRETSNRIKHTKDNLERLTDVLDEVEKQIKHLDRQAKTAERYGRYKDEERKTVAELLALRLRDLDARSKDSKSALAEKETVLESLIAGQRNTEAKMEDARSQQSDRSDEFNEVQGRYYKAGSEIARIEQAIEHAHELRERQQEDLEQAVEGAAEIAGHINKDESEIAQLELTLNELVPGLENANARQERSQSSLDQAETALADWQQRWDEHNERANTARQTRNVEQTRSEQLTSRLESLAERRRKLDESRQLADPEALKKSFESLSVQEQRKRQAREEFERHLADIREKINKLREQDKKLSKLVEERRATLISAQSKYASMEAIQKAALGEGDEGVQGWLESSGLQDAARVAQSIDVAEGWETAIETVLGDYLQAVCVDDVSGATSSLAELRKGSVTLLIESPDAVKGDESAATLASKVLQAPNAVLQVLRNVRVAETLDKAMRIREQLEDRDVDGSVITTDGIWLSRNWLRVSRDKDAGAGILSREHDMRCLKDEIRELQARCDSASKLAKDGRTRLGQLEDRREKLQRDAAALLDEYSDTKAKLDTARFQLDQANAREEAISEESGDIEKERFAAEEQARTSHSQYTQAVDALSDLDEQKQTLEAQRSELRQELERVRTQADEDRAAAHDLAIQFEKRRSSKDSASQSLARMQSQLKHFKTREQEVHQQLENSQSPLADNKTELARQLEIRVEVEEELAEARKRVETVENELRELDQDRLRNEQIVEESRAAVSEARMAVQEISVRREGFAEQFAQTAFDLQELLVELDENANVEAWEESLEKVQRRINRLGPINLAAIDEFKEQSERKEYLDSQLADLHNALEILESAIRKIDRETRTRFKETFDNIDTGFKRLFPKLFGGGHAYLALTGDDLLSAGVTVMARPPGKRNSTIHLLSGGEKALTAVALVFAIFELNPAPFCLLDEVDAPLDDANVARFCDIVKEMSDVVQFVFITHNKVTMEMARQLTGVTMQEPGVSRLVSVDLDEAVKMAAS